MKTNKEGISLIVLVITIIVMIILAAAIVITLSNSGIINKANEAVDTTNLKQVQELAQMIWAEGYLDKKDAATIKGEIEEELGEAASKYDITVTDKGVEVTEKGDILLPYFGKAYNWQESESSIISYILYEDGSVDAYENGILFQKLPAGSAVYEDGIISLAGASVTLSSDRTQFSNDVITAVLGELPEAATVTFTVIHDYGTITKTTTHTAYEGMTWGDWLGTIHDDLTPEGWTLVSEEYTSQAEWQYSYTEGDESYTNDYSLIKGEFSGEWSRVEWVDDIVNGQVYTIYQPISE